MDVQTFRQKFSTDTALVNLPDAKIQDALEEADLVVSQIEFGALKERAVGLYAAHILKVGASSGNGAAFGTASSMTIAGQSVSYSRSSKEAFYDLSMYGQRYLALKNSIPIDDEGTNPNRLGVGAFVVQENPMPFKYQAPEGYKPTKLVIAGQNLDIKNGVLESDNDIIHILKPLGFERYVEVVEPKKSAASAKE